MTTDTHPKSRATMFAPASRERAFARLFLSGPGGSGKTRTALRIAEELIAGGAAVGPIAMIDTEHRTGLLYADRHQFKHLDWQPPYDPRDLAATILAHADAAPNTVLIIDSVSHFWAGRGGTLQIVEQAAPARRGGNQDKFAGWAVGTPAQQELTEAIQAAGLHVICCARAKIGHEVAQVPVMRNGQPVLDNGVPVMRNEVRKLGMEPVQRDDFDYDMGLCVSVAMDHSITVTKTRADVLPIGRTFAADEDLELAREYAVWLQQGDVPATPEEVARLVAALDSIEPERRRAATKQEFVERFGLPRHLAAARLPAAREWVEKLVGELPRQFVAAAPDAGANGQQNGAPEPAPAAPPTEATQPPPPPAKKAAARARPAAPRPEARPATELDLDAETIELAKAAPPDLVTATTQHVRGLSLEAVDERLLKHGRPRPDAAEAVRRTVLVYLLVADDMRAHREAGATGGGDRPQDGGTLWAGPGGEEPAE